MKDSLNDQRQRHAENGKQVPQLTLRTDLRAGAKADADCGEGIGYWRKEYNYWKKMAESMGCA